MPLNTLISPYLSIIEYNKLGTWIWCPSNINNYTSDIDALHRDIHEHLPSIEQEYNLTSNNKI